jgi:hypothetical protein
MAAEYWVFEVTHGAPRRAEMYATPQLVEVFQRAELPPSAGDAGGFVGTPRVTRHGGLLSPDFQTTVVALYEIPDGTSLRRTAAILQAVRDRIALWLSRFEPVVGTWSDVSVVRWREPINGAVDWWRSGDAAATSRTTEDPPVLSTTAADNPRGPTTSSSHPTTPAETLENLADRAGAAADKTEDLLYAGATFGAVLLALMLANEWRKYRRPPPLVDTGAAPAPSSRRVGRRAAGMIRAA